MHQRWALFLWNNFWWFLIYSHKYGGRRAHPDRKLWADAYLAAFANTEGMRFVTFDRALVARVDYPVLLEP